LITKGWFLLGDYHEKIIAIADKLNIDADAVYDVIEAKAELLSERIRAEFAMTDECRVAAEHKKIIAAYKKEKSDFARRYRCDEREYDFCFNVFGELMNSGYYEKIVSNHSLKIAKEAMIGG
jgi:anaerobic ribonucleoside-triphosphate reductase